MAVCATKIGNEHFCGYVSTKLKLHLIWTIEEKNEFNQVEYCHISKLIKEDICEGEAAKLLGNDSHCEIRLIGMKLFGELNKPEMEERFEVFSKNVIDGYRLPKFMKDKSGIAIKLIYATKLELKNWFGFADSGLDKWLDEMKNELTQEYDNKIIKYAKIGISERIDISKFDEENEKKFKVWEENSTER
uniref:Uncharacterized protein n=1 Tax=Meloidogyne hapla TaxID=6305 RepID=A0A1I8B851_MELHA